MDIKKELILNEYVLAKDLILKRREGIWQKITYLVTYNLAYFGAVYYLIESSLCLSQKGSYVLFSSSIVLCANIALFLIHLREHCAEKDNWERIQNVRHTFLASRDPFLWAKTEKVIRYPEHDFFWFVFIYLLFIFCPILIFVYLSVSNNLSLSVIPSLLYISEGVALILLIIISRCVCSYYNIKTRESINQK